MRTIGLGEAVTTAEMIELIGRWFKQATQACGPILPDGWFGGRPYENQYFLKDMQASNGNLVLNLSEETSLVLGQPKRVYIENSELIIEGFEQATFRWQHYGGTEVHVLQYTAGQVRLVPPLGTKVSL